MRLTNPEFQFEFMGKEYTLRKATLDKAVQYQIKAKELIKEEATASDAKLGAYCVWLMLKDKEPTLTEDVVMSNIPADTNILELLTFLGFTSPSKLKEAQEIQSLLKKE